MQKKVELVDLKTLDLFQIEQEQNSILSKVFEGKEKMVDMKDKNGVIIDPNTGEPRKFMSSFVLAASKKEVIQKNLGLASDNKEGVAAALEAAGDDLKRKMAIMVQLMATSDKWTGTSIRVNQTQKGKVNINLKLSTIQRQVDEIERLAKIYKKSPEQIIAMIEKQLAENAPKEIEAGAAEKK